MIKELVNKVSEYFLGTETRRFYDRQVATVGEFAMYEDCGKQQMEALRGARDISVIFGKYLPNMGDILSLGAFAGYLASDNPRVLIGSVAGLVGSELLRFLVGRLDKSDRNLYEMSVNLNKTAFRAVSSVENLVEKVKQENQPMDWENDTSGYDGWLNTQN